MKKLWTFLGIQVLWVTAANAQQDIRQKIEKAHKDPKTVDRAARADVLLVHNRRWNASKTNIPAQYSIGPAPVERKGKN